jgi:S1-C subfamily serine protease
MRYARPILIALLLAAAFFIYTSYRTGFFNFGGPGTGNLQMVEAAPQSGPMDPEESANVSVYKKALPSVVNITSTAFSFNFFYGLMPQQGQGTGFIIDRSGYILTNNHVVEGGRQIEVTLYNRKKYRAQIVGTPDKAHDIAVLKIDAPNLTPAVLGDSRGLQVGQFVYAIGNPFGLSGTMTRGIVSSIRSIETPEGAYIDEAIQTDAAINPGNSGGPLLNSRGEVVGVNSMIATGGAGQSAGVGFAIPINTAKAVANDIVTRGHVQRPSLGISALPIGPELASQLGLAADYGVLIMEVVPGGAAERAGLHGGNQKARLGNSVILVGGDLIVAIDGQDIEETQDIARIMNNHRAGDTVTVTVVRGRRKMSVRVTLGEARQHQA